MTVQRPSALAEWRRQQNFSVRVMRPLSFAPMGDQPRVSSRAAKSLQCEKRSLDCAAVCAQTIAIIVVAVNLGWWAWPIAFILMGRAHAQFAAMMHEAAHRLLFTNKKWNDAVGRWALGYIGLVSTDAYRRVHMAHHRREFGPEEPDLPLYQGYPVSKESMRRKLIRDATGQTGFRLLKSQFAPGRWKNPRQRKVLTSMLAVHSVLLAASILAGQPLVYPLLWILPFLTLWRVINRFRSIAEHGGLAASSDRRITTHCVRMDPITRFFMAPYQLGYHLAHHVDSGCHSGACRSTTEHSKNRATSLTPTSIGHTQRCGRRCQQVETPATLNFPYEDSANS